MNNLLADFIRANNGILPLRPAWVAHDFLKAGYRLGLPLQDYDQGEHGVIMERWLCSETMASTPGPPNEGLSQLDIPGHQVLVADAVATHPGLILGEEYAGSHGSLGRLVKLFDFGTRLFLHMHQRAEHLVSQGKTPKDEAYHFLDAPLGKHPESFFGVQRFLVERGEHLDYFRRILETWEGGETEVLKYSMGFVNVPGEGFLVEAGILHAPGTALTLELQEPSDVGAMMQPVVEGHPIDRAMLLKDVDPEEVAQDGIGAVLNQVDWEASSDPRFFENRHLRPIPIESSRQGDVCQEWVFYGTPKFSGKRLVLEPGQAFEAAEAGVHNLFVWRGEGLVGDRRVVGGAPQLTHCQDELLVVHDTAVAGYRIVNTGNVPLVLYSIFGPDINAGASPRAGYARQ